MNELVAAAFAIRARAYAPYSNFAVGVALRDETGAVHAGCNVENAAYPQGWCAEASAIAALIGSGARRIVEVALVGDGAQLITPCGGCRQKLREFAAADCPVHCAGADGVVKQRFTLGELLPAGFGPDHLRG